MTARAAMVLIVVALIAVTAFDPGPSVRSQQRYTPPDLRTSPAAPDPVFPDTTASIDEYVADHIDEFATPEFYRRLKARREFQRTGYLNVLHDVAAFDALGALLSFIRVRLQLEYSLPHNTISFRTGTGALWPLPEDWIFPADPWTQ
jgi:hypothetical protein